MNVVIENQSE